MKVFILSLIISLSAVSFSQNEWWKKEKSAKEGEIIIKEEKAFISEKTISIEKSHSTEGKIEVIKNPSIEKLIKFKATAIPPNTKPLQDGYRIQLFFDQNKREVDEARKSILNQDNEAETYILFRSPNYVLFLGNYRTQLEAEKVRAHLLSRFPEAIVIKDKIELPRIPDLNKSEH